MKTLIPNEPPPLSALAEAALAIIEPQDSVTRQSLLTVPKFPEQIEEGLVCTAGMDVHDLGKIVIAGFAKFRLYYPYIKAFIQQCENLPRNSRNQWKVPVCECTSLREFFETKCQRTADAVYKMIRRAEEEEKQKALPPEPPTPKPPKKPAVGKSNREIVLAADLIETMKAVNTLEAELKKSETSKKALEAENSSLMTQISKDWTADERILVRQLVDAVLSAKLDCGLVDLDSGIKIVKLAVKVKKMLTAVQS